MTTTNPLLIRLQAEQAATHAGNPNGLGQTLTAQERADLVTFANRNKPKDFSESCSVATDHANTDDIMVKQVVKLMGRLITSKYYLKELEHLAMDWLED
jgi:hypothetical protein